MSVLICFFELTYISPKGRKDDNGKKVTKTNKQTTKNKKTGIIEFNKEFTKKFWYIYIYI